MKLRTSKGLLRWLSMRAARRLRMHAPGTEAIVTPASNSDVADNDNAFISPPFDIEAQLAALNRDRFDFDHT